MIELQDWLKHIKNHGLLFKFEGVRGDGRRDKADYHASVGKACTASDDFMNKYMDRLYEDAEACFHISCHDAIDIDDMLSRFCEYAVFHVSAGKWAAAGLPIHDNWAGQGIATLLSVVNAFPDLKDDYLREWVVGESSQYWEDIEADEEYLIKQHPPEKVWCHSSDTGVDVDDVFFVCPSCHGEPQTEQDLKDIYGEQNGFPRFYCGSCSAEMQVGEAENILDFFNALEVTPYPFNPKKQEHWKGLMTARKDQGKNNLGIEVGDLVYLEECELTDTDHTGADPILVDWKNRRGDLVRCTSAGPSAMEYEYADGSGTGGVIWGHVWGRHVEGEDK